MWACVSGANPFAETRIVYAEDFKSFKTNAPATSVSSVTAFGGGGGGPAPPSENVWVSGSGSRRTTACATGSPSAPVTVPPISLVGCGVGGRGGLWYGRTLGPLEGGGPSAAQEAPAAPIATAIAATAAGHGFRGTALPLGFDSRPTREYRAEGRRRHGAGYVVTIGSPRPCQACNPPLTFHTDRYPFRSRTLAAMLDLAPLAHTTATGSSGRRGKSPNAAGSTLKLSCSEGSMCPASHSERSRTSRTRRSLRAMRLTSSETPIWGRDARGFPASRQAAGSRRPTMRWSSPTIARRRSVPRASVRASRTRIRRRSGGKTHPAHCSKLELVEGTFTAPGTCPAPKASWLRASSAQTPSARSRSAASGARAGASGSRMAYGSFP